MVSARRPPVPKILLFLAIIGAAFFVLPLAGLVVRAPWSDAAELLRAPSTLDALRLSMISSLLATSLCILLGVPLAWILARVPFRGQSVVRGFVTLPMVLPPVVGGTALLLSLGQDGLVGRWLDSAFDAGFFGTTAGVIVAEAFVAMPFLVLTMEAAFRSVDQGPEEAAATLGAPPWLIFRRVLLPASLPALVAGSVLAWARALGEFGATITFAGNFQGSTQTMPLAVFEQLQEGAIGGAIILSLILVLISLTILVALRHRWWPSA